MDSFITPSASVWIPFGSALSATAPAPELAYFRRVKEHLAMLYDKYNLIPGGDGINVCIEHDVCNCRKGILAGR